MESLFFIFYSFECSLVLTMVSIGVFLVFGHIDRKDIEKCNKCKFKIFECESGSEKCLVRRRVQPKELMLDINFSFP